MILRILASVVLLFSILFMPFWVSVILGLAGMVYFPIFGEAVFIFFLFDLLYGTPETRFFDITYVSFIISVVVLVALELIKKKLRFYPHT